MKKKNVNFGAIILLCILLIVSINHAKKNNYSLIYLNSPTVTQIDPTCPNIYIEDSGRRFYFDDGHRVYIHSYTFTDTKGNQHKYTDNVSNSRSGLTGTQKGFIFFFIGALLIGVVWLFFISKINSTEHMESVMNNINEIKRRSN